MTTIYLDTCALNRLTDDPTSERILSEANAVDHILSLVYAGSIRWVVSPALHFKLARNPHPEKREQILPLLAFAQRELSLDTAVVQQAIHLQGFGFSRFDALHLAVCQAASVDCLLTVDDRFLRRSSRLNPNERPEVLNPVNWVARRTA